MTEVQTFLLQLLGLAVQGNRLTEQPEGVDWKGLYLESCAQTVTLPMLEVLSGIAVPEEVDRRLFEMAKRLTTANLRAEHAQGQLVQFLEASGYPYVILKGQSAAAFYPQPELRQLGDVDFLVPTAHTAEIAEKMTAQGYTHTWEPGDYHQVLEKAGAYMEMHMAVAGMPQGRARPAVEAFFSTVYEESVEIAGSFGSYRVPCNAHHAMVLLLHMQHHTVEWGMGLRHLMDWACFVNRTAQEPFWEERVLPLLRQIGLLKFAAVITKICHIYLSATCPPWAQAAPEDLCRAMMEDFLRGGNFGGKDQDRKRAMSMLPDWESREKAPGKLRLLYRTLRQSVMKKHPRLGKCPVLRFFLMCGRIIRFLFLFACGKRPNLIKAASHADQRKNVYQQLQMYEPEE